MGKIIRGGIEYGGIPDSGKYWEGTQAQYDAITTKDPNTIYFITDSDTGNYGINDLADVTINSVSGGDVLRYNYSSDKWENEHVDKTPIEKSGNLITSAAVYSAIQNIHDSLPKAYLTFSGTEYLGQITLYTFTPVITDERGYSLSPNQLIDSSHNLVYDCYFVYNTLDGNNDIIYTNILKVTEVCPTVGQYQLTIYAKCPDCYSNVCVYASFNSAYTSLSGYVEGHADVYESKTATSGGTALSVVTTGEKYSWNNKSATEISYSNTTSGLSATNVQGAIDEVESVVSTSNISNFITLNDLTFPSGTTNEQSLASIINTYGKKTISFGYVTTGDGWYAGMITFHQNTQGGGFLVRMGNGKLWSITYVNGTITLYEK